jgi:uncharacterized protein YdeI (YjbR/CyaY-like superfamily)
VASEPEPKPDLEVLDVRTVAEWEAWLERHHEHAPGVWLRLFRKAAPEATLPYPEAVEVALCFGWIDGQTKRIDEISRLQRFTPRRARSNWAASNVERVARLTEQGRMRPAGQRAVDAAKADGRWPEG